MSPSYRIAVFALGCGLVLGGLGCEDESLEPVAVSLEDADPNLASRLKELLAAARSAPQSSELRGRLAIAYEMNGFPAAALATYAQAGALGPDEFNWPYFEALLLAKGGDMEAAIVRLDRALALDENYVPAWLWRGKWLLDNGAHAAAEASYRRAEALDAGTPAVAGIAEVRIREGSYSQAVALLEPAVSEKRHPHLYRMLGEAYRGLGREEDARIAFARGRQATPLQWFDPRQTVKSEYIAGFKNQMAHAQDLLSVGRYDDALEILKPWESRYSDDAVLLTNLGWTYMSQGDFDRALEIMQRGLAKHATDTHGYYFHYHLGRLHAMRGALSDAMRHLEAAIDLNPTQSEPHEELADLFLRLDRHDEALASFRKALEVGSPSPELLLQTMGVIDAARGRWDDAIEHFSGAVEENPSFAMAYVQLGRSLAEVGRWAEAGEALDKADRLGTNPEDVTAARRIVARLEEAASAGDVEPAADGP